MTSEIDFFNWDHLHFSTLASTHDWARQHVDLLDQKWLVITADEQTSGRAQGEGSWVSPPDMNLYMTIALPFPNEKNRYLCHLPQIVAFSICQVLEKKNVFPGIKWINDLLLRQKKFGGILCHTIPQPEKGRQVALISMGINVNMPSELLQQISQPATSLHVETGKFWNIQELRKELLPILQANIASLLHQGFSPSLDAINQRLAFKGEKVHFQTADQNVIEGIVVGISLSSALQLQLADGSIREFLQGRIWFLK